MNKVMLFVSLVGLFLVSTVFVTAHGGNEVDYMSRGDNYVGHGNYMSYGDMERMHNGVMGSSVRGHMFGSSNARYVGGGHMWR